MYVYVYTHIYIHILSSSAEGVAKSDVKRRVSEAEPATSAGKGTSGVPPNTMRSCDGGVNPIYMYTYTCVCVYVYMFIYRYIIYTYIHVSGQSRFKQ